MGVGLVTAAGEVAARLGLDHAPARLFLLMAAVPHDKDPKPTYWKGRAAMARALGKASPAGDRAADRAVASLVKAGAIEQLTKPAPGGRNARWALLDGNGGWLSANEDETRDGERRVNNSNARRSASHERATLSTERATVGGATRDGERRTEEYQENKEEGTRASAPARTCTRHPDWNHNEPCRRCGDDRRAAETFAASRRPATMSEQRSMCAPGTHRLVADGTCMLCTYRPGDEEVVA